MLAFLIVLFIVLRSVDGVFDHNVHSIHAAVDEWLSDRDAATIKYGHISDWDTYGPEHAKALSQSG